jgi:hypothetical protein
MAALVNYGSSDEEESLQEESPGVNVSFILCCLEQADSTDPRSEKIPPHKLPLRMASSLVGDRRLLYSPISNLL